MRSGKKFGAGANVSLTKDRTKDSGAVGCGAHAILPSLRYRVLKMKYDVQDMGLPKGRPESAKVPAAKEKAPVAKVKAAKRASKKGAAEKAPEMVADTQPPTEKLVLTVFPPTGPSTGLNS